MASAAAALAAQAGKEVVSPGIPLRCYYRSAHNVRRQAEISLLEGHIKQGYVYLLKFTSLMLETIPRHKDYNKELLGERAELTKHVKVAMAKLETLRPIINEEAASTSSSSHDDVDLFPLPSRNKDPGVVPLAQVPWSAVSGESGGAPSAPPARADASRPTPEAAANFDLDLLTDMLASVPPPSAPQPTPAEDARRSAPEMFLATPGDDRSLPRSRPRPSSQTLNRHMLMPSLSGPIAGQVVAKPTHVTAPQAAKAVQYPTLIDDTPVAIPEFRDLEIPAAGPKPANHSTTVAAPSAPPTIALLSNGFEAPPQPPVPGIHGANGTMSASIIPSTASSGPHPPAFGPVEPQPLWPPANHPQVVRPLQPLQPPQALAGPIMPLIRQPSIPPVEVPVTTVAPPQPRLDMGEQPPPPPWEVADPRPGVAAPGAKQKNMLMSLHLSARMLEEFMRLARDNTLRNLETCAVLAGTMKNERFSIHTLIIPKQESTSDSCTTVNEEEIFRAQDERDLFSLGWIHTHPTQTCFMSSIDLHTHCAYQVGGGDGCP
eukprot:jgi/Mesvir1/27000/Mv25919-RA.2